MLFVDVVVDKVKELEELSCEFLEREVVDACGCKVVVVGVGTDINGDVVVFVVVVVVVVLEGVGVSVVVVVVVLESVDVSLVVVVESAGKQKCASRHIIIIVLGISMEIVVLICLMV